MLKLVPYWRSAWRLVSVWLGSIATVVTTLIIGFPEAVLHAWNMLPVEIKSTIPPKYIPMIGAVLMAGAVLSRLVHQPKTQAVIADKLIEKAIVEETKL